MSHLISDFSIDQVNLRINYLEYSCVKLQRSDTDYIGLIFPRDQLFTSTAEKQDFQ